MNDVINPFQITHPTSIQTSLLATALFSKFDPSGRWIAAGKQNGSVVIWDLNTRAPVRVLDGHVRAVTSIDWSRYGRYVLTSSKDWNVIVWDLAERLSSSMRLSAGCIQRMKTVRFDSSVMCASFHPRNSKIILVLLSTGELFITDLRREYRGRVELCDTLFQVRERELRERENREREKDKLEEGEEGETVGSSVPPLPMREAKRSPITVARFDISGRYVFAGTANGMLLVFNTRTKAMVGRHKITGAGTMKSLDFTRNGRRLVTNSSDRILRQFTIPNYQATTSTSTTSSSSSHNNNSSGYSTPTLATATTALNVNEQELEPTHRFNDPINKTAWHVMAYSPDGEWLAGGSADPATHKIYIWDLSNDGQFSTALDGGREPLAHIHWHPAKSLIASTTTHGNILIWHCPKAERWGAFAGGFEEVDENIEYEEREDEFDIEDEEVIQERKMKAEEQEVDIDDMDTSPDESPIVPKRSVNNSESSTTAGGGNGTTSKSSPATTTSTSTTSNAAIQSKPNSKSNSSSTTTNHVPTTNNSKGKNAPGKMVKAVDEDAAWADEDPDEDVKGWKMHISKGVAELAEELGV